MSGGRSARRLRSAARAWAALVVAMSASCKRHAPPAPPPELVEGEQVVTALSSPDASTVVGPRCTLGEVTAAFDDSIGRPIEASAAIVTPGLFAFGYLAPAAQGAHAGTHAGIVTASDDLTKVSARTIAVGNVAADGAPPAPLVSTAGVAALVPSIRLGAPVPHASPTATSCAVVAIAAGNMGFRCAPLTADPPPRPVLASIGLAQANDVQAVWDLGAEVAPDADAVSVGSTRFAAFVVDDPVLHQGRVSLAVVGDPVAPRAVSPPEVDASSPRLAPRSEGAWVVWLAERPERDGGAPSSERIEAPGELRTFVWAEAQAVDAHGAPTGGLHKLSSMTGHVGDLELAPLPGGALDVFLRDDDQAKEGAGGRIVRVRLASSGLDAPSPAAVVVDGGVGHGALDVLVAPSRDAWLAFDDTTDHTRLVPLDAERAPLGRPSAEPAFDGGRPLAATDPESLVGMFPDEARPLRAVKCTRAAR